MKVMISAIILQDVNDRLGRAEPCANKRRPKSITYFVEPHPEARKHLANAAQ